MNGVSSSKDELGSEQTKGAVRSSPMQGNYVKSFNKFKKFLSTRKRCMITTESSDDYCSQVSGIVLDFMFKFPDLEERGKLLK